MRTAFRIIIPLLILAFFLTAFTIPVESLQIRVFAHLKINSCQLSVQKGTYRILGDGNLAGEFKNGVQVKLVVTGDSIEALQNDIRIGVYKYIKMIGGETGEMRIKLIDPERNHRYFQNNFSFSVIDGGIRVINEVEFDNYIAGVTEAEAGPRSNFEFYKVQTILVRTFALAHVNKHVTEGYSLCDLVHCQAYYGRPNNQLIYKAVNLTKGKVVVDENLNLINAAFHSNSGGQTANSEDVWGSKTSYLKSIVDTFSVQMPNSRWERRMLADDWLQYLKLKHNYPVDDDSGRNVALNFRQEERKVFLEFNNARVPLKNVRQDLQLKSTYFSISRLGGDSILIKGRGYGHGLGMCQEGAMCMARKGYSYIDILNFYYRNVQLIDLHKLSFFKDE
jgi:stage II sporulation protein D